MENFGFILSEDDEITQLVAELGAADLLVHQTPEQVEFALYDSFDWRLYQQGWALYRQADCLVLQRLGDGAVLSSAQLSAEPGFAWDLPDGSLKAHLAPVLDVRRLLRLVRGDRLTTTTRVLNQDEKTVARLVYEELRVPSQASEVNARRVIWVQTVRGYPRYARKLKKRLERLDMADFGHEQSYHVALSLAGRVPGDYSARLEALQLAPQMRADEATKTILRFTLGVMRRNEAGILADLDTEFLHDYRVAVRRTRSALTQIRQVFPERIVGYFNGEFAKLGQLTNPLRDLDVYLLKEPAYREMLPESLREGIAPLFDHLRVQRMSALKSVRTGLKSENYRALLAEWQTFLDAPLADGEDPSTPNAARAVIELARERIEKRYRRVMRDGEAVLADAQIEDEKLHALRIDCKKLRYLLEFFASLFPPEEIDMLVKQLKRLQDNLGDFNDLSMQSDSLLRISQELPVAEKQARETLAAIGCLVGVLNNEKVRVRSEFAQTFRGFAARENHKRFRRLFAEGSAK